MAQTTLLAMVILLALNANYIECMLKMDCSAVTYETTWLKAFVDQCAPKAWAEFFEMKEVQEGVLEISGKLANSEKKNFEPAMPLMFKALELVRPDQVKVIILGQDPTPQAGKATGLAFSVDNALSVGTALNVLLEASLEGFSVDINNGDLTKWANQGVLLLNTAFTCPQTKKGLGQAKKKIKKKESQKIKSQKIKSHLSWWYGFSDLLIKYISDNAQPSVWLLWGNEAHYYYDQKIIDDTKHYIIRGGHPSSLGGIGINTFFGGNYFNCANTFLTSKGRGQIDWKLALQNVLKACP